LPSERTFLLADLTAFAQLSGDFNPLHTDPVAARRTQFGECVTHGVLVLMWALDCWQEQSGSTRRWKKISAKFLRPVPTGVRVTATITAKSAEEISIAVGESGRVLLQCDVIWAEAGSAMNNSSARDEIPPREAPVRDCHQTAMANRETLELFWPEKLGRQLFPSLAKTQLPDSMSALLATTRLIGMKVPGEHSVFLQLDLAFELHPEIAQPFTYRVTVFRKSLQRLGLAIAGSACQGMLWALVRPAPVAQPDMAAVRQQIPSDRFRGRRVIIIGGSRGLGEIAAKVLTAGGAEVALSYRLGGDDAKRVVADITAHGGQAFAFQFDTARMDWEENLAAHCLRFNHLCYFPTPPIVGGDGSTFNSELFAKFCDVYVAGLVNVAQWLAKQNAGQFALFNASTVYVESPPLRNLEYAAAKAASEACGRWLAGAYPKARVYAARFPRLNTDQTASFLSEREHDNLEIMLLELSAWLSGGAGITAGEGHLPWPPDR
jgi:acyl dehydratase/NAD(P)-dependent dehydrogenase (short-subunit alcohol dehydrogenase family)